MSEEQEQQLGLQSYQQILSEVETVRSGREFELVREWRSPRAGYR
jgi:hypothetical protein